jgi:hypothetical protein
MAGFDSMGRPIVGPADAETRRQLLLKALRAGPDNRYQAPETPKPAMPVNKGGGFMRVEKALRDSGA